VVVSVVTISVFGTINGISLTDMMKFLFCACCFLLSFTANSWFLKLFSGKSRRHNLSSIGNVFRNDPTKKIRESFKLGSQLVAQDFTNQSLDQPFESIDQFANESHSDDLGDMLFISEYASPSLVEIYKAFNATNIPNMMFKYSMRNRDEFQTISKKEKIELYSLLAQYFFLKDEDCDIGRQSIILSLAKLRISYHELPPKFQNSILSFLSSNNLVTLSKIPALLISVGIVHVNELDGIILTTITLR
jgi:hypothetical protein